HCLTAAPIDTESTRGCNIPVTAQVSDRPIAVDGWLYGWGMVTYTDNFRTKGRTKFCHRYPREMFGKDRAGLRSISVKHARYHEVDGNEVDYKAVYCCTLPV